MTADCLSSPSPFMSSAIPPPRPVSVNALARTTSVSNSGSCTKSNRSTSAEIPAHEESFVPVGPDPPGWAQSPVDTEMEDVQSAETPSPCQSKIQFEHLPVEIHETILDYLFGERSSTFTSACGKSPARGWNKSLRHPRRKALSNLALILPVWRVLVQDRIYRHIKLKGTTDELEESARWFCAHPHLALYVRHVEIWIPVWGQRAVKYPSRQLPRRPNDQNGALTNAAAIQATMAWDESVSNPATDYKYHYASHNATLEEMFVHVQNVFPGARILTLEGGHCKKPPMVRHFRNDPAGRTCRQLPVLPDIQTFVMRGAWNIMRDHQHWLTLSEALPRVREWQCAYAKSKIEGYETIAGILRRLPPTLVHINISLEGFYNKDSSQSRWLGDGANPSHLCHLLGEVAPRLESLTFTGKVCSCLFESTRTFVSNWPSKSKLRSLDLVVKTCCRDRKLHPSLPFLDEFSGITNLNFIRAFEKLVISAIAGLQIHQELDYMRIRFIDLDSACPPLNPYFQLVGTNCTGLWNEPILEALHSARPNAQFVKLSDGIAPQYHNHQVVGALYPRTRPLSIHASTYRIIADVPKP
ncbi:hypothetical protein ASPSYDRAFT_147256 [Aspergillus sydowii CBS 593.65]|uniref:Uncharacterized protein n=1 Tax=Aspergillus sydowii CBS 593.65 TaxID=1036612 RepID=A0A1L9TQ73_9EURO|nr:uncharacterized protein ASPSYDRAFT_147256 [Aspergillus sydowii CBS 593.65]OJJ61589.1 hypothetical protein ASPSYDRAFT_147256 [Aspergillus sydowii CBS 593.65]